MKCVLETAREDPFKMTPILNAIMKRAKLLQLASQPEGADAKVVNVLQANLCWEVQAFCHANGWPTELIKKIFFQLYEKDAVVEDGFLHWKEDLDDATPARRKRLPADRVLHLARTADEEDKAGEGRGAAPAGERKGGAETAPPPAAPRAPPRPYRPQSGCAS